MSMKIKVSGVSKLRRKIEEGAKKINEHQRKGKGQWVKGKGVHCKDCGDPFLFWVTSKLGACKAVCSCIDG